MAKADGVVDADGEYMQLLQSTLGSEVDKFFNRNCSADSTASPDAQLETGALQCPVHIAEEVIQEVSHCKFSKLRPSFNTNVFNL